MIALSAGGSLAEIVPERGALCSRLRLAGSEILFLDPATLADPGKNVRGGVPVLFPIAGKAPEGSALKQHGFARNLPWEAVRTGEGQLECRLRTPARDDFVWPTEAQITFTLSERALRLDALVHNPGDSALPFQLGFHPYFFVPDKAAARVETTATRAFDNRTGQEGPLPALDFTRGELDLHLLDHAESGTILHRAPEPAIRLRWSPDFHVMVLWTLPGKDFVCVEPWTAKAGALATGQGLVLLPPGETRAYSFEISL